MLSKVKDIHIIKNLISLLDSQFLLKIKYSTSIRIVRSERDRKIVFFLAAKLPAGAFKLLLLVQPLRHGLPDGWPA